MRVRRSVKSTGRWQQITSVIAIVCVSVLALAAICGLLGARINLTSSLALGLYWQIDAPLEKGSYAMFCPPETAIFAEAKARGYLMAGSCPGNVMHMSKRVMGTSGDAVQITTEGVYLNGILLPLSRPLKNDMAGRVMPHPIQNNFTLGSSELLLMSDINHRSFDARYFGAIDRAQITYVIRPIFTW